MACKERQMVEWHGHPSEVTSIYGLLVCYCEHIWNNTPLHLDSWFLVIYELT